MLLLWCVLMHSFHFDSIQLSIGVSVHYTFSFHLKACLSSSTKCMRMPINIESLKQKSLRFDFNDDVQNVAAADSGIEACVEVVAAIVVYISIPFSALRSISLYKCKTTNQSIVWTFFIFFFFQFLLNRFICLFISVYFIFVSVFYSLLLFSIIRINWIVFLFHFILFVFIGNVSLILFIFYIVFLAMLPLPLLLLSTYISPVFVVASKRTHINTIVFAALEIRVHSSFLCHRIQVKKSCEEKRIQQQNQHCLLSRLLACSHAHTHTHVHIINIFCLFFRSKKRKQQQLPQLILLL